MFSTKRTKPELDKYIAGLLGPLRDEKERQLRGFQIAQLYREVQDYETAKRYLAGYLVHRDEFAPAHKLMAQILESQRDLEKAIASYRRSLELDDKQKDVLVKICELYCQMDVNPDRARYWADRLEKTVPQHEVIFRLREHAIGCMHGEVNGTHSAELEELLASQLAKNPKEPQLRIKLVRLYIDTERMNEAFTHVTEVEKKVPYPTSLEWYRCVLDVLQEYRRESGAHVNGLYHRTLLHTLNSLAALSLEQGRVADAMEVLYMLDQTLGGVDKQDVRGDAWVVLLREMHAQFFYHAGTLLLKKAKQDRLTWKEASGLTGACYLCSCSYKLPNIHAPWFVKAAEDEKRLYEHWYSVACFRASQAGHMVRVLGGSSAHAWMRRIQEEYCTSQGKSQLYSLLFTPAGMAEGRDTSFVMASAEFTTFSPEMPRLEQLQEYEQVSQLLRPEELGHVVWTALRYYSVKEHVQPTYYVEVFDGLQHGVLNLETASPESLCLLDIQAFVYCVVREAWLRHEEAERSVLSEPGKPEVLPVLLCDAMVTPAQAEWWATAYRLFHNAARDQLGKMRLTLQRGLEVIRLVGNHGMGVDLVVHLSRAFEAQLEQAKVKASSVLDLANEIASLQARTTAYWKAGVDMIEKRLRGQSLRPPKVRLFEGLTREPSDEELLGYLEQGRYYLATVAMEEGRTEVAIELFEKVSSPEAAFNQAEMYKGLAEEAMGTSRLQQTADEVKDTQVALLTKAREKLYQCLDRIRGDRTNKLNDRLADDIDDVEARLANLESDQMPRTLPALSVDDVDAVPDPHKSFREPLPRMSFIAASTPRRQLDDSMTVNVSSARRSISSTSPMRTRPSPERLEAQIRSLSYNQDTVVKTLVEELKEQRRTIQQLQEKLESERMRHEEEKAQLTRSAYDATRSRDDERRTVEFDLIRVEEEKRRLEEERRRMEENHSRREAESAHRMDQERERAEQRYAEDRERVEELKRDLEEKRQAWQEEKAQWARERDAEKAQWARERDAEKAQWARDRDAERVQWARERLEQEERLRRLQQAAGAGLGHGLPTGLPHAPRPQVPQPPGAADIYGSPFRGYPQAGFDVMQGYAGYGFPQYGPLAGGLQGYNYQEFPSQQQDTTGAQRIRGHRAHNATVYTDDDEYYDSEEDTNVTTGNAEATAPPVASGAYYMSPQQPGITPIVAQMPGPGFFSTKVSTSQPVGEGQSAAPHVAGKPITLGSMVSGGDVAGSALAGLLATSTMASQAQGVALYQGQRAVPTSVVVPQVSSATSPINTRYPISLPQSQTSTANLLAPTHTTAAPATAVLSTPTHVTVPPATATLPAPTHTTASPAAAAVQSPAKPSVTSPAGVTSQDGGEEEAEQLHDSYTEPHFEPLVTLPEVEVKTGEEEETVVCEARAKLLRFIDDQWKERGLGQIKILKNPNTGSSRVLMRREKIHKVCANHFIKPEMKIDFREKERNYLTWRATDYTEKPRIEQFCCKFKTSEIAEEFKRKFEQGVEESKKQKASGSDGQTDKGTKSAEQTVTDEKPASEAVAAAPKPSTAQTTVNATQPRPVHTPVGTLSQSASTSSLSSIQSGGFTFGMDSQKADSTVSKPVGGLFGMPDPTKQQQGTIFGVDPSSNKVTSTVFGNVTSTSTDEKPKANVFGGFTFSQKPEIKKTDDTENEAKAKVSEKKETEKKGGKEEKENPFASFSFSAADSSTGTEQPIFGSTKTTVGFGDVAKEGSKSGFAQSSGFTGFKGTGATVFGKADSKPKDDTDEAAHHGGEVADYEPDVDFKPIVTLPEVEVKTGEEEEEKLFCQRAKLYRMDLETKQWKERGVGELKLLRHKASGKCRLLMRRDQVLKICANHRLSAGMTINPLATSVKTYTWAASDFSEQELKPEMFAAKFKTQELADSFRDLFRSCVEKVGLASTSPEEDSKVSEAADTTEGSEVAKSQPSLAEQFKPKEGEWECPACYVRNAKGVTECVACGEGLAGKQSQKSLGEPKEEGSVGKQSQKSLAEPKEEGSVGKQSQKSLAEMFKPKEEVSAGKQPQKILAEPKEEGSAGKQPQKSLAEMFKPKEGEWECPACYVRNTKDVLVCVACESAKPGCEKQAEEQKNADKAKAAAKFAFGAQGGSSTAATTTGTFSFGFPKTSSAPSFGTGTVSFGGTTVTFGGAPAFGSGPKLGSVNTTTFGTGGKNGLSFTNISSEEGSALNQSGDKPQATPVKGFSFNTEPDSSGERKLSPEKPTFSFGTPATGTTEESGTSAAFGTSKFTFSGLSPQKSEKTPKSPLKSPGEDGYYQGDEGEHIHFEPIVEMPKDYEHKTGEEEEKVLYAHRAKLFRFVDGQWKERGLGDVKILLHQVTKKVRMVMRREQVFRICLNHYVVPEIELKPMPGGKDKAFTWHADDFAEGEVVHENLAIRFKTADIANHFKQVFDLVKAGKDIPESLRHCPVDVPPSPGLAQKSPVKSPAQPEVAPVTSSLTPATFTFKSPEVTSASTPAFSAFKFAAPTFGSGVFGVGSSPSVFGSAPQTTTASGTFTFGQTTFGKTTVSQQPQIQETPKSTKAAFAAGVSLFAPADSATGTPSSEARESAQTGKSPLNRDSSLLRSLLTEDQSVGNFSALRSAIEQPETDDDVIFVSERTPSKEQESRASQYMLPKCFFMYEDGDTPSCAGCVGCDADSFDFDTIGQTANIREEADGYANEGDEYANDYDEEERRFVYETTEVENIIVPQDGAVTGDRGNVHYAAQLGPRVKEVESVIVPQDGAVTGDRGNVHYAAQLGPKVKEVENIIVPQDGAVTGDRGNVHYGAQIAPAVKEETIQAAEASHCGEKGNVQYGRELAQAQADSTTSEETPTFGSFRQPEQTSSLFGNMGGSGPGLGFGDLAKQSPDSGSGFAFGKKSDSAPFQWQGAGASVFGSSPSGGGAGEDGDVEQAPDVHFEPIVSLPEVEVVTGEEQETVMFCERAKLYRFVSTEKEQAWKERGVGEVKILKHQQTDKFRVLMRRDKILKIACNHQMTVDMKLKPMQTSETAWCWNALDFAENEPKNEQFALKFKKKELASNFRDVFERCQEELRNQSTAVKEDAQVQPIAEPDTTSESPDGNGYAQGEAAAAYQEDEEDDEEYEEEQVEFSKRVTMHYMSDQGTPEQSCTGELRVIYDDDVIGYRIVMTSDQGEDFCNHIICRKYTLQKSSKKRFAEWAAKDFVTDEPLRRTFRVTFSSVPALDEFVRAFKQGIDLAKDSELDEVPDSVSVTGEILVPEVASSPKGGEE